ncbi:DNA-3-methyladenine glycosylase [bacterium]|nr:DNA-3-methyladenine glycosylase [bacterium]
MRFKPSFFMQDALAVAEALLGHFLVRRIGNRRIVTKIVETEAYCGVEDKGCHTFGGRRTERTEAMFLPGGHAYIYMIYGMNFCLNVVSAGKDDPQAVLIRAVEPLEGIDFIKENRKGIVKDTDLTNGPGKLAKALLIDKTLNGCDLVRGKELFIEQNLQLPDFTIVSAPRVNIDYAGEFKDKPWRKYIAGSKFVSKP